MISFKQKKKGKVMRKINNLLIILYQNQWDGSYLIKIIIDTL